MNEQNHKEEENEKKNKRRGMIATVLVHVAVLLLLLFLALAAPYPPPGEEGILINFGSSDVGSGTIQPIELDEAVPESSSSETSSAQEEVATQDVEDAPSLENAESKSDRDTKQPKEKEPTINREALFDPSTVKEKSTSEGKTTLPGDMGAKDGDPNASAYGDKSYGLGSDGTGWELTGSGRKMIKFPRIDDTSQETGRVVIRIKVNKEGKVVSAEYRQKGSTTTDAHLIAKARKAALLAKFNSDPGTQVPTIQTGTITFNFIVE